MRYCIFKKNLLQRAFGWGVSLSRLIVARAPDVESLWASSEPAWDTLWTEEPHALYSRKQEEAELKPSILGKAYWLRVPRLQLRGPSVPFHLSLPLVITGSGLLVSNLLPRTKPLSTVKWNYDFRTLTISDSLLFRALTHRGFWDAGIFIGYFSFLGSVRTVILVDSLFTQRWHCSWVTGHHRATWEIQRS